MKTLLTLLLLIPSLSWGNPLYELFEEKYEIVDTHIYERNVIYILSNKKEDDMVFHCLTTQSGEILWCKPVRDEYK